MSEQPSPVHQLVDHLFRREAGKMVAVLTRVFGLSNIELAEDVVQETLLTAYQTWKLKGVPSHPQSWLYQVARNKALTHLRREQNFRKNIAPNLLHTAESAEASGTALEEWFLETEIEDAQLRMMFACCHPAIAADTQLILMLKTLCGLNIAEIAAALLSQEDTIAKRLYRAKEKIRQQGISLDVPLGTTLAERLDAVLKAIYLLFNEAYKSTSTETIIRRDLAEEALRLGAILAARPLAVEGYHMPKINALMALLCFHAARFDGRLDENGQIILLENQDRSLWDPFLTRQAYTYFKASTSGNDLSEYHIEAAIASYHAKAPTFQATNWKAIYHCYNLLFSIKPSSIVAFNRAIVWGYAEGPKAGIEALLNVEGLDNNHLYHAALGDFYRQNGQVDKARAAYELALKFAYLGAEKKVIGDKLEGLST